MLTFHFAHLCLWLRAQMFHWSIFRWGVTAFFCFSCRFRSSNEMAQVRQPAGMMGSSSGMNKGMNAPRGFSYNSAVPTRNSNCKRISFPRAYFFFTKCFFFGPSLCVSPLQMVLCIGCMRSQSHRITENKRQELRHQHLKQTRLRVSIKRH